MKKEVESVVIRVSEEQVMCLEVAAREVGAIEKGFGGVYKGVCAERNRAESPITGSRNVYLTLRTEMADAHKVFTGLAYSLRTAGYADVRASVEYSWGARQRYIANISYILARDPVTREAGKEISPAQFFSDILGVHHAVAVTLFRSERQDESEIKPLSSDIERYYRALVKVGRVRLVYQPSEPSETASVLEHLQAGAAGAF